MLQWVGLESFSVTLGVRVDKSWGSLQDVGVGRKRKRDLPPSLTIFTPNRRFKTKHNYRIMSSSSSSTPSPSKDSSAAVVTKSLLTSPRSQDTLTLRGSWSKQARSNSQKLIKYSSFAVLGDVLDDILDEEETFHQAVDQSSLIASSRPQVNLRSMWSKQARPDSQKLIKNSSFAVLGDVLDDVLDEDEAFQQALAQSLQQQQQQQPIDAMQILHDAYVAIVKLEEDAAKKEEDTERALAARLGWT
jgi:hypothetical protein